MFVRFGRSSDRDREPKLNYLHHTTHLHSFCFGRWLYCLRPVSDRVAQSRHTRTRQLSIAYVAHPNEPRSEDRARTQTPTDKKKSTRDPRAPIDRRRRKMFTARLIRWCGPCRLWTSSPSPVSEQCERERAPVCRACALPDAHTFSHAHTCRGTLARSAHKHTLA